MKFQQLWILCLSLTGFLVICLSLIILQIRKNKGTHYREKLFTSLIKSSDTIYLMRDHKRREIIYITNNLYDVLGLNEIKKEKTEKEIVEEIFATPIVQNEFRNWNGREKYETQMFSYQNPLYRHTRWIRIKIYPLLERKKQYDIILIYDATKEHDQQHLLVTQAKDIKAREQQLSEITTISYDFEINVNLLTNEIEYHRLKNEFAYFGDDFSGEFNKLFPEIIEKYVDASDRKEILSLFSIDNFNKLVENENLEPLSVRYKLLNEDTWLESTAFFTVNRGEASVTILTKNVTENAEYMRKQNVLLQNALNEAKKANDAKTEFLTIMSHEIRTPMNAIIGLSSSALTEDMSAHAKEDIENINGASTDLLEIIDGILDISKVEKGILVLNEKEYNVPKFLNRIIGLEKERLGNKKLKLVVDIDKNIPTTLFGDSGKIKQIINNILDNSIRYTEEGSITLTAKYEEVKTNINLILEITDTGIGMKKDQIDDIFSGKNKNSGLGIVKSLVDLLKGKLEIESTLNKGTKVKVTVLQKVVDKTPMGDLNLHKDIIKKVVPFDASSKKILVVDDNKLNLKVATRLLEPYKIQVETCLDGNSCIDLVKENNYDLILMDIMMPELSGTETLTKLKENKKFNIPVIALTADAIVGKKEEYLKAGYDDYLSKPIDTNELDKILKKYLK